MRSPKLVISFALCLSVVSYDCDGKGLSATHPVVIVSCAKHALLYTCEQGRFVFVDGVSHPYSNWPIPSGGGGTAAMKAQDAHMPHESEGDRGDKHVSQRSRSQSFSIDVNAPLRTSIQRFLVSFGQRRCPS